MVRNRKQEIPNIIPSDTAAVVRGDRRRTAEAWNGIPCQDISWRTTRSILEGEVSLEKLYQMKYYRRARKELMKLSGVGEKVADCICLFALHHMDAFPIDTHIRQVLDEHYRRGFPNRRYHGMRGIMQQYIFYYELIGERGKI